VTGWDTTTLIELAGGNEVDILKIDIEGSEAEVFRNGSGAWLPKVRNIVIELHGEECAESFFGALRDFDYELEMSAELAFCWNIRPGARSGG
jgi:hypothetical protein